MNSFLVFILAVLLLEYLLSMCMSALELRALSNDIPEELSDVYDEKKYQQSQQYARARTKFAVIQETLILPVILLFILSGGFNRVDLFVRSFHFGEIATGLLFAGVVALLSTLMSLPFKLYSTFVIEQKFGFNTTTLSTFFLDMLKAVVLSVCIGGPILAMVLWFFLATGELAWLYCWAGVTLVVFLLQFAAPVLIMPLFNKFTPLEEGELKERITRYATAQKFTMKGIYTMDGSKRSTRLNAFFTGFGRFRRIVFFDTLVEKLSPTEIVAVLAHEMGHYKHNHIFKMMTASVIQTGIMLFILSLFLGNRQFFAAFGMEHISVYAGLFFFGFLYSPVSMLLSIGFNYFSRKHEFEADAWAVNTTGTATGLINGLKKLSSHNLANLTPHPFNVFLQASHPPLLQRIHALTVLDD